MTKKKIHYLLSKHSIKDTDVYSVFKEFFKEYLQAKYEFTFEELHEELKKIYLEKSVRDGIISLIDRFSTIEYQDDEIPQDVLRDIIKQFDHLIDQMIHSEKKGGFLKKLFGGKKAPMVLSKSVREVPKEDPKPLPAHDLKEHKTVPEQKTPPPADPLNTLPKLPEEQQKPAPQPEPKPDPEPSKAPNLAPVTEEPNKNWEEAMHNKPAIQPHQMHWNEEQRTDNASKFSEFTKDVELEMSGDDDGEGNIVLPASNTQSSGSVPVKDSKPASAAAVPQAQSQKSGAADHPGADVNLSSLAAELDRMIRKPDLDAMIADVQSSIDAKNDLEARSKYKELLGHYDGLSDEQKHPFYERIQHLYESMKKA